MISITLMIIENEKNERRLRKSRRRKEIKKEN